MAKTPNWQGKRIVHDSHAADLEHRAALHEFEGGHPRQEAERLAYDEYRREHHRQAAAHHLRGMRAAQGSGDMDESRKHGIAYGLHLKALGLDPMDEVPADIRALIDGEDRQPQYKFKTHKGDALLLQDDHEDVHKSELEKGDVVKFPGNPAPAVDQGKPASVTQALTSPQAVTRAWNQAAQATGFGSGPTKKQAKTAEVQQLRAQHPPPQHNHTWGSLIKEVGSVLGGECGARALDDDEDYEATAQALSEHFGVHPDVIHHELANHGSRAMDDDEDLGFVTRNMAEHLRNYFGLAKPRVPRKK